MIFGLKVCSPYPWKVNMHLYPKHKTYWKENILWVFYILFLEKAKMKKTKKNESKKKKIEWQEGGGGGRGLCGSRQLVDAFQEWFSCVFVGGLSAAIRTIEQTYCFEFSLAQSSLSFRDMELHIRREESGPDASEVGPPSAACCGWVSRPEGRGSRRIPSPCEFPCVECKAGSEQDSWICIFFTFWLKGNPSFAKVHLINSAANFFYLAIEPFENVCSGAEGPGAEHPLFLA